MSDKNAVPIRVFLIDDHKSILWGLERLIEQSNAGMHVVGSSTSCTEAFPLLDQVETDVVLLDLDLGRENGLDAIPEIIRRTRAKVLILTGVRDKAIQDRAIVAGALGIVGKEAPAETILTAINKVYSGQLWLDREATGRVFVKFLREDAAQTENPDQQKIATLTGRERQIISAMVNNGGSPAKVIAETLHISEHTLRNHLTSIYDKLEVSNRLELFAFANKYGLGSSPDR
jgi:two-component system nitrate/nitrite response regulator NarL